MNEPAAQLTDQDREVLSALFSGGAMRGREVMYRARVEGQPFVDAVRKLQGQNLVQVEGSASNPDDAATAYLAIRPSSLPMVRYILGVRSAY